ncbi:MAG TPA: glycosyltransferase family 2 protein [Gallionella sp.]|nr:glycosyltransferase family 2 protein [Gallionella sp.]
MSSLAVIILTLNEEKHIERCVRGALQVADQVFVVDSFSSDATLEIAQSLGAQVRQHEFRNHAAQLAWALESLPINTEWVMRVDADEVITPAMADEIRGKLPAAAPAINGFMVPLYVRFQGGLIRHGGYPQWQLRIWRTGKAEIEQRWMDEKIVVQEPIGNLQSEYIDDNLNNIAWWTNKHNGYSTREAIDILNRKYGFLPVASDNGVLPRQARYTRWLKENLYLRLPLGLRAFLFFTYRMIFRFGIMDGRSGFVFHFLQGFWYRFLVDVKVREVERRMRADGVDCAEAIRREFGMNPLP